MKFRTRSRWGAIAGLLAALVVMAPIAPAHAQNNAPAVGVVDEDKLGDNYTKYKDAVDAVMKREQDLLTKLKARQFLNTDESKTFDTIIVKDKPSDAESKQLDDLTKTGLDRSSKYLVLMGQAVKTDADNATLKSLQDTSNANAAPIAALQETLSDIIRKQQETVDNEYTDKANGVIQQVASDKKLVLVFRSQTLAWWATTVDITDEVLKRLNAK